MVNFLAQFSAETWAKEGGTIGLVLFALFSLIIVFIKVLTQKDKRSEKFVQKLIDDERVERKETRRSYSKDSDRLKRAIDSLTDEIKNNK
tara:strand:- start:3605 stop:3874 length:270 start_codon:yes stop_codon:yes gene_type:complete